MSIAITGSMGCGKSTVLAIFEKQGYTTISSDNVVASLFKSSHPKYQSVATLLDNWLGTKFRTNTEIDKQIIKSHLQHLEDGYQQLAIKLKPIIVQEILALIEQQPQSIVEAPLLFEMQIQDIFDVIICVSCERTTQLQRIKERNPQWSDSEIEQKINAQLPQSIKIKQSHFVIHNEDINILQKQVKDIIDLLKT